MRTQITLGDREIELLDEAARRSGASRSELIRRAVHLAYGAASPEPRLAALQRSAGTWQARELTGAEYVETIRGDLNERLTGLGLT